MILLLYLPESLYSVLVRTLDAFVETVAIKICISSISNHVCVSRGWGGGGAFSANRDIQNFIVCAIGTFKTLLFVQSGHSKLYCLCNRDIPNFIVCAIGTFQTLLFVQSGHSKLYCLRYRDIQNSIVCAIDTFKTLLFACPFWGSIELRIEIEKSASHRLAWHQNEHQARGSH